MARSVMNGRLLRSASLCCVLAGAGLALGAPAVAQTAQAPGDAEADSRQDQDIIVTGTRIRGVAPVGSAVIQLDQEALARTGQLSTADILNRVPSVLSLGAGNSYSGGSGQGTADLNALSFNKSPNLRGFGPQATLSLVNGHRVPYDGANMNTFDGDNIPTQMLQRIDIVADGTSANYGADAIAGTVNYVMRRPFTGLELYAQDALADGQNSYQFTAVGGYDWGSGGIVIAFQHGYSDALAAGARPSLYSDDFTAVGGPASSTQSSPGNIVIDGVTYAIPAGQDGRSLTLSQVGAAGSANRQNVWTGYDAIPNYKRNQLAVNFRQTLLDGVEIFADGFYSDRNYALALFNAVANNRNTLTIPNSNYYSPCNRSLDGAPQALIDACGTGALTVNYNTINDIGPGKRFGFTETISATLGTTVSLFGDWKGTLYGTYGKNRAANTNTLYFGNSLATLPALGGTTADTAFNPFCDGTAFDCGNDQFADAIFAGNSFHLAQTFENRDLALNLDGSLFDLPGGKARLAVGGEHFWGQFVNANDFATTVASRKVNSGYAELYVPLFGDGNAMPGLLKLELTAAIRIDDYNDVGSTTNPKFGINWSPVDGLKFHGSYGTSFRAPGLVDNDPNSQRGVFVPTFDGSVILPSLCPSCAANPAIAIYQAAGGAAGNLKPETSTSWSLGLDYAPPGSGFNVSLTYWNTEYTNQVATPVYNAGAYQAINQGYYDSQIIFNPAYFPTQAANNPVAFFGPYPYDTSNADCSAVAGRAVTTQALYDQFINCLNAGGNGPLLGAPSSTGNVVAVTNSHRLNSASTKADGFDFSIGYDWGAGVGRWHLGAMASYVRSWKVSPIQGAPEIDQVNHFGYPLRFRGRAEAGWSGPVGPGNLTGVLYFNYANKYRIDPALLPLGISSDYTHISSYTTVDLALNYDFGDRNGGLLHGFSLSVSAQNIFDRLPPFVVNTSSTASIKFDPSNGSPLGRIVQFQLAKKF